MAKPGLGVRFQPLRPPACVGAHSAPISGMKKQRCREHVGAESQSCTLTLSLEPELFQREMKSGGAHRFVPQQKSPGALGPPAARVVTRAGAFTERQAQLCQARPRHPTGRHHPIPPLFRSRRPPSHRPPARPGGRKLGSGGARSQAPAEFQREVGRGGQPVPLSPLSTAPGIHAIRPYPHLLEPELTGAQGGRPPWVPMAASSPALRTRLAGAGAGAWLASPASRTGTLSKGSLTNTLETVRSAPWNGCSSLFLTAQKDESLRRRGPGWVWVQGLAGFPGGPGGGAKAHPALPASITLRTHGPERGLGRPVGTLT